MHVVKRCNYTGVSLHVVGSITQEPVIIGGGVPNEISYTVMIGSLLFTGDQCNTSNQQCTLKVPGSNLTEVGLLDVSVVAFNAIGSGNPATFPMSGI